MPSNKDHAANIERLRERIETSDDLADADRDLLIEFSDRMRLLKSDYSLPRHEKLLRHATRMGEEVGNLAGALDDRDAAEQLVIWINETYENEETNRDYRSALRVFSRRVSDGDETPESIEWVPTGTSGSYNPQPDPADMLDWEEDVRPMIDACHNPRDRAMIALQFDAGLRSGEFQILTIGDITDHDRGLQVRVDGKQGQRSVTLIPSVPWVTRWLAEHPDSDDSETPLWCKLHGGGDLSYKMKANVFKEAGARADITKPLTITNFRKSSASYLASRGMPQAHLEDHHGWVRGSTAAARYIAVFADAADNELARIHGQDVSDDEPDPIGPVECPRCGKQTPRSEDHCVWCSQSLDHEKEAAVDEAVRVLEETAAKTDDPETALDVIESKRKIESDPQAMNIKELHRLISSVDE